MLNTRAVNTKTTESRRMWTGSPSSLSIFEKFHFRSNVFQWFCLNSHWKHSESFAFSRCHINGALEFVSNTHLILEVWTFSKISFVFIVPQNNRKLRKTLSSKWTFLKKKKKVQALLKNLISAAHYFYRLMQKYQSITSSYVFRHCMMTLSLQL